MRSVQRARTMFTAALQLDFIHVVGIRTEVTSVLLRGWNLTLALLVSAFMPALDIHDVIHDSFPPGQHSCVSTSTDDACIPPSGRALS